MEAGASGKSTKITCTLTLPVDFNRSLIRGKPIATSPRPSKTGTLQNATEFTGAGAIDGVGVGVGVGEIDGVGEGVATGVGVGVGDGVGVTGFTGPILCHTNFLFFLTHLNWIPAETEVLPAFAHAEPSFIAAKDGVRVRVNESRRPITTFLTR